MLDPDRYDEVAEAFNRYSELTVLPITECLLEMTRVRTGHQVLDVACGSGIVTRRAAALVGPAGRAVGIDLSPGQIRVARERAAALRLSWNEYLVMDAMKLRFADRSFDVVVAQFPHLPDRARCMAEMFRVLRPGGAFAIGNGGGGAPPWPLVNTPQQADVPTGARLDGLFGQFLAEHFPALAKGPTEAAPVARADPRSALHEELVQTGFTAIALWSYAHITPFSSAEQAFEWESLRSSSFRMAHDRLDPDHSQAFEAVYLRAAQPLLDRFGVLGLTTGALFGSAIRPMEQPGTYTLGSANDGRAANEP